MIRLSNEMRLAIIFCALIGFGIGAVVAMLEEMNRTRITVYLYDPDDISPADISALVEEAKRITGESSN